MFPLCRTCAMNETQQSCKCPDKERVLINTWCTPEINLVINMGYILIEIYELLNWSENTSNERNLFSNYINMFLQMKTQASGYPSNVIMCEQKNEYIEQLELPALEKMLNTRKFLMDETSEQFYAVYGNSYQWMSTKPMLKQT